MYQLLTSVIHKAFNAPHLKRKLSTFIDTELTQFRWTKSPAVHIANIAFIVLTAFLVVVVELEIHTRNKHLT